MHFEFEHNNSLRACEYALNMLVCAVGSVFRSLMKSEMQIFCFLGVLDCRSCCWLWNKMNKWELTIKCCCLSWVLPLPLFNGIGFDIHQAAVLASFSLLPHERELFYVMKKQYDSSVKCSLPAEVRSHENTVQLKCFWLWYCKGYILFRLNTLLWKMFFSCR